ncbi:helix-turn-helix transcriptional regulator [Vampirovibrio sp.]|uniref:helix-turn-helix transcriptional regulator n=1 Tax=Vampirovibrio sp. TaxID=2717857 RepID=UPI0035942FCB
MSSKSVDTDQIVVLLAEMGADSEAASLTASRRSFNGTAYRIFKLLQWLIDAPLTVEALNQKFINDPSIGKAVSSDSVWLYINTLKALGCVIRRPSPRNGFAYEMLSHPFNLTMDEAQLETLAQAKIIAQRHFAHPEMLALDSLLRKLVSQGSLNGFPELVERLFVQSRSLDSQECRQRIEQLERAMLEESLLEVTYVSPLKGEEVFQFLPESLFYRQGVVYVRGERPEYPDPSSLRVDRMLGLAPLSNDPLRAELVARQHKKTEVSLKVMVSSPQAFQGFCLDPNQGVYQESRLWVDGSRPYYEVRLLVRDFFYLKQTLLSLGLPFVVMAPAFFKEDLLTTLRGMLDFYEAKEGEDHGGR